MTPSKSCPQCGASLPSDALDALCPACLMSKALASGDDATMKLSGAASVAKGAMLPSMFPFDFGGYHVLGLLGRGGMGAVYEAQQMATGRRVALKVLGHGMDSEEMRKRFLREGRLAAAVSHPNSIYIFGTEEIEGSPVIVMEIAGGGTLKDELKRRGPLPVRDAVDAMLQVIAGLEAAHAGGVLHRDVKPANCFVSPDGTVKVGDFGLSVSTLARTDTQLTASGMMLGTPSFAPPEQLRGDELDLRADIYSVGATLHTLLTGRVPFEGDNAVQVVAAVLDKAPKSVAEFRKDVPAGLASVIARCMAKKCEARFPNYAALRDALLPFSSQVPQPAPLGLRFAAGLVDDFLASLPELVLGALLSAEFANHFLSQRNWTTFLPWLGVWAAYIAYFAIAEGLWGAGFGKALCGLRVVGPQGQAPGIGRALVRMLVYDLVALSMLLPLLLTSGPEYEELIETGGYFGKWWFWVPVLCFFGLFATMRRSNSFAALQDLISGTRVVLRPKSNERPKVVAAPDPANESSQTSQPAELPALAGGAGEHIGPFVVIKALGDHWIEGNDEVLRRRVWIHRQGAGAAPVSEARRDAARGGRLRWIGGGRCDAENWDAYEAPKGQPLLSIKEQSQPWALVRHWLADLADEIDAGNKDNTLPASASLENVWVTHNGRAVLLDEQVQERDLPGPDSVNERHLADSAPCGAHFMLTDANGSQAFLNAVAAHALDPKTVPLHARDVLHKLAGGALDRMSFVAGNLQSLLSKPATISRRRRAASLVLLPLGILLIMAFGRGLAEYQEAATDAKWTALYPDLPPLSAVLRLRTASDSSSGFIYAWRTDFAFVEAAEIHIAAHYVDKLGARVIKKPVEDPDLLLDEDQRLEMVTIFSKRVPAGFVPLLPPERRLTDDAAFLKSLAVPLTSEKISSADARVRSEIPKFLKDERRHWRLNLWAAVRNICGAIAIVQFLSLLIVGATPGQRVFGFAVLDKKGGRAGRLRMLGRWCIIWLPFFLVITKLDFAAYGLKAMSTSDIIKCSVWSFLWLICVILAIVKPEQGFHDEQAGTWIVPR